MNNEQILFLVSGMIFSQLIRRRKQFEAETDSDFLNRLSDESLECAGRLLAAMLSLENGDGEEKC